MLIRIPLEIDAHLEAAEIQRRVYRNGGPAVLYERVKGCRFRMLSNLFASLEQSRFLFRDTIASVQKLVELGVDPSAMKSQPFKYLRALPAARHMRPKKKRSGPVLKNKIALTELPALQSWPDDGGAFVTLPQVYSEDPNAPGTAKSNLGMYRIQLTGNDYDPASEIGLHYQIHRGIGVHHSACKEQNQPFPVHVFVGGTPSMTLSSVMPLPEGMSELMFAGVLAGHRIPMVPLHGAAVYGEADFCICGEVDLEQNKPEGPFGDHLGYYSLSHPFPYMKVHAVYHRDDAIWPFTVVGRPPQEDTSFGELIHELTGPAIPATIRGVKAVHAVDVAGVHPLLFAIGSERYTPYDVPEHPQEILTQANAILGQGQLSLAKYLLIVAEGPDEPVDIHDVPGFFEYVLRRCDFRRDLHFQTCTTIDTLDYSGSGFNQGSKLVVAAVGPRRFDLACQLPTHWNLSDEFRHPRLCLPGCVAIEGPRHAGSEDTRLEQLCQSLGDEPEARLAGVRCILLGDDSDFLARNWENFFWATFTRSNPAVDLQGVRASIRHKHWGCEGPLVIDVRVKPHHAPPLIEDPEVTRRVDELAMQLPEAKKFLE